MSLELLYKHGGRDVIFNVFLQELESCFSISEVFKMAPKYAKYFDVYSEVLWWMRQQLTKYSYSNVVYDLGSASTIEGGKLFQIMEFPPEIGNVKSWNIYLLYHDRDTLYLISKNTRREMKCKDFACTTLYLAVIYEDYLDIYTNIQHSPIYTIDIKLKGHVELIETVEGLLLIDETSNTISVYMFDEDGMELISEEDIETIETGTETYIFTFSYGSTMILKKQIIKDMDGRFIFTSFIDYEFNKIETGNLFSKSQKIIPTGMTGIDMVELPNKAIYVDAEHSLLYLTNVVPKTLFEFFAVEIMDSRVNIRDVVSGNLMESFILDKPSRVAITRCADGAGYCLWVR